MASMFSASRILRSLLQVTRIAQPFAATAVTNCYMTKGSKTVTVLLKDAAGKVATDPAMFIIGAGDLTAAITITSGAAVSQMPLGAAGNVGAIYLATPDATTGLITFNHANLGSKVVTCLFRNSAATVTTNA
jgi:hypothetical protein